MKKSLSSRIAALAVVVSLILGIVIGMNVASTIQENRMKAYAYEQKKANTNIESYFRVENALFPSQGGVRISQTAYEHGTAPNGSPASHGNSVAMDIIPDDRLFIAPFSGKIVAYAENCNEFIFQSDKRVRWSDDTLDYVSMFVLHSNDIDIINESMNQPIEQGDPIYSSNPEKTHALSIGGAASPSSPHAYADHFDIQIARGRVESFAPNAARNGNVLHYNCLFINEELTTLYQHPLADRAFNISPDQDPYEGYWFERNVFKSAGYKSNLKVSCPCDLAFEQDYSLIDILRGRNLSDSLEKMIAIENVVNNYISLDYDGLSDFEKKVYNACEKEWDVDIPDQTFNRSIVITFDAGDGATCDEERRIIKMGTCSTPEFPTPRRDDLAGFEGWFDDAGNEVTCDSLITENIVLHAKWQEPSTGIWNPSEESKETTIVSVEAEVKQAPNVVQEETPQERVPISAESVRLNRTSKDLNLVGNSRSFTLTAEVFPTNAEDRSIRFESSDSSIASVDGNGNVVAKGEGTTWVKAIASNGVSASIQVHVHNEYKTVYGPWSEYSKNPVTASDSIEVQTMESTEPVIDRYRCVYYCTMDLNGNRIYDSKSRNGDYTDRSWRYGEWSFAEQLKDPSHDYWDYTPEELGAPVAPGEYLDGNQAGYNGSNQTLYTATYGWDVILVSIKETLYKDVPVTLYRSRTVTRVPVEYN